MFQSPSYAGSQFMRLKTLDGGFIQPKYANGGAWLPAAGDDLSLVSRMTRCILGHAPIGAYYERFNIPAEQGTRCGCGALRQTRDHILKYCPQYSPGGTFSRLEQLLDFLTMNPRA